MRRYFLIGLVLMIALIGTVTALDDSIVISGTAETAHDIHFDSFINPAWDFNYVDETTCNVDYHYNTDGCVFNDGDETDHTSIIHSDSNLDDDWNVTFTNQGFSDSYLHHSVSSSHVPNNPLQLQTADITTSTNVHGLTINMKTGTTGCTIGAGAGGSCDVWFEVYQEIEDTEIGIGSDRLKAGSYSATIVATLYD